MSDQYFGLRPNPSDRFEKTDQSTNNPVASVDAAPVSTEIPMEGTIGAVGSVNETNVHETFLPAAPVGERVLYESPAMSEAVTQNPKVAETGPYMPTVKPTQETPVGSSGGAMVALLTREESEKLRTRWNEIQAKFVDEPRSAVQQADALVAEVITQITQMFANNHGSLESQWNKGNDISTEDLRTTLQHYRSFFNRLVV